MSTKPPIWASFFTITGLLVLCALGFWQLQRLEWKTGLLAALDAEYSKNAASIALTTPAEDDEFLFRRGTMQGTYDFDKQIALAPRVYEDLPGQHVITPLHLDDGSTILVNRGWVPQHWSASDEKNKPRGRVSVTGLLRQPDNNPFAPDNVPEKNQWYSIDRDDLASAKQLKGLSPYVLYREAAGETAEYPLATATKPQLNNHHLQYAIFWFTLAGALSIIYFLRFMKKS